jgi:hypothetical protein
MAMDQFKSHSTLLLCTAMNLASAKPKASTNHNASPAGKNDFPFKAKLRKSKMPVRDYMHPLHG